MKLFKHTLMVAAMAGTMMFAASCSNDDDIKDIPSEYSTALSQMFPGVKNVQWEQNGSYKVADFYYEGFETEAWFNNKAQWAMTQTEYNTNFLMLPAAVQETFLNSQYSVYSIDDIDGYVRQDVTFYVIEVEQQGVSDQGIYITADGTITQVLPYDAEVTPVSPIY